MSLRERAIQRNIVTREDNKEYTLYEVREILTHQTEPTLIARVSADDDEWIYLPATLANIVWAEGIDSTNNELHMDPLTVYFTRQISKAGREYINYEIK